jgi:HPt (histidine-containing phosphotransfer) domain-containing protein
MDPQKMREMLAGIWERHRPEMEQRLAVLTRASETLDERELTPQERTDAVYAAHKLAGALGTFGRSEGSDIARSLERSLESGVSPRSEIKDAIGRLQIILGS